MSIQLLVVSLFLGSCTSLANMGKAGWATLIGWTCWIILIPVLIEAATFLVQHNFINSQKNGEKVKFSKNFLWSQDKLYVLKFKGVTKHQINTFGPSFDCVIGFNNCFMYFDIFILNEWCRVYSILEKKNSDRLN